MTTSIAAAANGQITAKPVSAGMTTLLAAACGLTAANIYYAQPLIGLIAPAVRLSETAASLIVTFTQIGYCLGLVLLVHRGGEHPGAVTEARGAGQAGPVAQRAVAQDRGRCRDQPALRAGGCGWMAHWCSRGPSSRAKGGDGGLRAAAASR